MASSVNERVQKRRETLRAAGLRPVQIWVPDTRRPGFAAECHRQSVQVALADAADPSLQDFLDAALDDLDDEGEA
ncbi:MULTISPECIES: antitoxin MazE family protein [Rhizobium]|uniref:Antitoxin MazE family protein n=5 Tax=Rhizobium TaxID=379 RepID=A0A6P1CI10_RHITR|nr:MULTISPECIES: antitoxin MazE family protein [Rhizobium]AGB73760.1 hypothetical protein RTCIAT899_PB02665 [Rhizobium tropici CIAT 899]ENN86566.1 hypothetical protein RHSP_12265 [Rhizobium freirei PRF 81]MBB4244560.1 hypothetical protein [Rhizobium tropici]MBB4569943.1 hypothetical protein [Rhizobium leucaenae]MBB5576151.1 hypothetical protein [Rhizobium paranaense]